MVVGAVLKALGKIVREPLVHFLLIGAMLFAAFQIVDDTPVPAEKDRIVISETEVAALVEAFRKTWRRPPNESELDSLIEDRIREEVFVREAISLGLDQNDTVVRRRLRQKMEFLTSSMVEALEPDESEVRRYFDDNRSRFERVGRVAFEQVFLGETPADEEVDTRLEALRSGNDPAAIGARSLIPPKLPLSSENQVDGTFGRGFFKSLGDVPVNVWSGPLNSGYGIHLVRVTERRLPALPPFEEIRDEVLRAWRAETQKELLDKQYQKLKSRYEILLPAAGNLGGGPQ